MADIAVDQHRARGLEHVREAAPYLDEQQARTIETGVYNWAIAFARRNNVTRAWSDPVFRECYGHRLRHIALNLDPASYVSNGRLRERLEAGEVRPEELATMRPDQIVPEAWRAEAEAVAMREEKALKPKAMPRTDRYRCAKCKKNDCSFYEMQIRSGDEGSTIFVHCNNCGHGWRIN